MSKADFLFLADWDGCCNGKGGPGVPWDLWGMAYLQSTLKELHRKAPRFGLSILTGRSDDLEIIESLGLSCLYPDLISGFENGAICLNHSTLEIIMHPMAKSKRALKAFELFDQHIAPALEQSGGTREDKKACRTVTVPKGTSADQFLCLAEGILYKVGKDIGYDFTRVFYVTHGGSAVDFILKNSSGHKLDKEFGADFLMEALGVEKRNTIFIGDGNSDLDGFKATGHSGAPANASPKVKEQASVVAEAKGPRGTAQIIRYYALGDVSGVVINPRVHSWSGV